MFDDQPIKNPPGTPPGNLPVGEPEDMFADTDPVANTPDLRQGQEQLGAAADSISQQPTVPTMVSAVSAGVLQPKQVSQGLRSESDQGGYSAPTMPPPINVNNPSGPYGSESGGMPQAMPPAPAMSGPVLSKGLIISGIIFVSVLVAGGGAWWVYTSFIRVPNPPTPTESTNEEVAENDQSEEVAQEEANQENEPEENDVSERQQDDEILFGEQLDDDEDGLANDIEAELGTDPQNWDSDGDELSDGNEVLVWNTDPLNPDTDGDTYLDGLEVKSGYSPTGEGRIAAPPSSGATIVTSTAATESSVETNPVQ